LGAPPSPTVVEDWSPSGDYAVIRAVNPKTRFDIWLLPVNQEKPGIGAPVPYLVTEFAEAYARVSPDGHWLAYTSNESKRNEIYVQSFPIRGSKFKVSMAAVRAKEVDLALRLIDALTVPFEPLKYLDGYRDGLQGLIRTRIAGPNIQRRWMTL
jgi:hypothetical protein